MAAVVSMQLQVSLRTPHAVFPFPLDYAAAVTEWFPPYTVVIPTGTAEESIVSLLTQGLTTITTVVITSDQAISVTCGAAGSNVPIPVAAHGFLALAGTSLTALAITNASGVDANVTIGVGGA